MGRPKPLVKIGDKTILQQVLLNLRASAVDQVVVVLGHHARQVEGSLKGENCSVVINPRFAEGMSSSIRRGLGAIDQDADAVMIVLGDQPFISPDLIDRLLQEYADTERQMVVPICGGRRGHPVIFGRRYWPELCALRGDVGGRELFDRHADDLLEVAVADQGILLDIDHPGDAGETPDQADR
jgi:molybdenum cofactor cytidylyltransferase